MSKEKADLFDKIMAKIQEKFLKNLKKDFTKNWTNRGMGKSWITLAQTLNRTNYGIVKQFSRTRLAKEHPEVLKRLVKEMNRTRKIPVIIEPTFGAPKPILSSSQRIRRNLLQKRSYYARKQKNLAKNLFNETQFVGFLIEDPEDAIKQVLASQKRKRVAGGGTRKISNTQIEAEISELKKGVGVGYFRNKKNFESEEARLNEVVQKMADQVEQALLGVWSEALNFLYKEYNYDWQTKDLYWILQKIDKLTQIEAVAKVYNVNPNKLIEKLKNFYYLKEDE